MTTEPAAPSISSSSKTCANWWGRANGGAPTWEAQQICALAETGDPVARRAVEREGYYLGLGLANLITIFAPDCIALGGGVMQAWHLFENAAVQVIRQNRGLVPWDRVRLLLAALDEVGLLGAASTLGQLGDR